MITPMTLCVMMSRTVTITASLLDVMDMPSLVDTVLQRFNGNFVEKLGEHLTSVLNTYIHTYI